MRVKSAASGRCASVDVVSLLTMPQLAGKVDWFLLQCEVRWFVRWYLLLQRYEAQLNLRPVFQFPKRFPSSSSVLRF